MKRISFTINLPTVVAVLAVGALLAYQAPANPQAGKSGVSVATVNLGRALDGLEQRADAEIDLRAMQDGIETELETREAKINELKTQLEDVAAEERTSLEEKIALESLNFQAWLKFVQDKVDVERALLLQDLYRSIKNAVAELAKTGKYDLVVVDDSKGELTWTADSPITREAQTLQQIRARGMLFASNAIDVTDDLVARMNNEHRNK